MSGPITEDAITPLLTTSVIGRRILAYERIGSTQDVGLEHGERFPENPDGTIVVADHQVHGRGRLGRRWIAPPDSSLLFSVVVCPRARIAREGLLTLAMAVAVLEAIVRETGLSPHVKWPNDVVVDGSKVCGVLTETGTRCGRTPFWVVGVGLNVNLETADLPPDLSARATSLMLASGLEVDRVSLLVRVLAQFEDRYAELQAGHHEPLIRDVRRYTATLGTPVRIERDGEMIEGVAADLDDDGALIVRTPMGVRHRLTVADGTLL